MQSYAGGEGGIGIKKIPAIRQGFKILSFLSLQAGYVASCRAFSAAFDGEGNFLTFVQRFVTIVLNSGEVYEHVFRTVIRSNKAEAFIILNMPNNVTFDSSSATLKPAGANTLTGVAMVLKEYPKTAVNVVGYTDSTGSHDLNMRLSQQRADSVASSLITQGVDASRIRTSGMGPANPIASNSTAEGKAQNRRVEITLSPLQ